MEFWEKLKRKLQIRNILYSLLFLAAGAFFIFVAMMIGFSSESEWKIGPRGTSVGIPLPNWMISLFMLLMAALFVGCAIGHLLSFIKNKEFSKLLAAIQKIGDPNTIGQTVASLSKSPYIKSGDLRYNPQLLFYLKGTDATIIAAGSILRIQTEIVRSNNSETNFLCVYHNDGILKIAVNKKKILPLLEDMRKTLAQQPITQKG